MTQALLPWWYWAATGGMLAAVLASFAGVVYERVPEGRSIGGRSACACGRQLRAYENIPVVGWVAVGGKTRCCGARMPAWYALTEAGWALAAAAAGAGLGLAGVIGALSIGVAVAGVATVRRVRVLRRAGSLDQCQGAAGADVSQ